MTARTAANAEDEEYRLEFEEADYPYDATLARRSFVPNYSKELGLAMDPAGLVESLNQEMAYGTLSDETRQGITSAVENVAMEDLPVDQRAALALVALEGYSYAEAAETLDVSIGTIMSRVHRARHKLVEAFNDSPPSLN